jgi:hypothetical protein
MFSKADAEAYFNAEKSESLLFLIIGLLAIGVAVGLLLVYKSSFYKGFALPLMLIGIIQSVIGYTVYSKSDKQRTDIVYKMDMNPGAIGKAEVPRMEKVMKRFIIYRYAEIILLAAGAGLFVYFRKNEQQFWGGIGIALTLQAGLLLLADGLRKTAGKNI